MQVEYTSRPPGRTRRAAQARISRWRFWQPRLLASVHSAMAPGSRRNMPSPEHGASTSTASNASGNAWARRAGLSLVTAAFHAPMRSRFDSSTFARRGSISLATSAPAHSASRVALPPGAAHKSSTRSPRCAQSTSAGTMALGSWR